MQRDDLCLGLYRLKEKIDKIQKGGPDRTPQLEEVSDQVEQLIQLCSQDQGEWIDFKAVVDNLVDGVYVTDSNAITRYVNPAYSNHTGIAPEEIIGRSVTDIVKEGVLFKHAVSADVIRWGRVVTGAGLIRTVNGRNIHGYVTGVPLFDENGKVKNVVVSVFDAEKIKRRVSEFDRTQQENAIQIHERFGEEAMDTIIGSDKAISEIRRIIIHAAPTDATVLITGESGVGKEAIADRLFSFSNRTDKPYVKVNCTAIPANLLESELFGYEKGAFTGAKASGKMGLFELANRGTILLDEIGDLPIELQTKLLRVLQQKELQRLGGTAVIPLDVRIIAATNANLKKKIQEGTFREDLYYRLSVIPIHVPPLRQRRGDIAKLVKYYFKEYTKKHERDVYLTDEALLSFEAYDWPGNVRELQNILEYLIIVSEGSVLDPQKLSEALGQGEKSEIPAGLNAAVEIYERELIENALKETGGVRKAAAYLKVDPSTISRKTKKYGIRLPEDAKPV